MARNSLVTAADLAALPQYPLRQRAQVLACYLLDSRRWSMQEVAQQVLGDYNAQAGQRVSLITRSYGFSARNAGRYANSATEQDIWDFVRSYQPERTGGLPEGTFDDFLLSRQEQRRRERQQEQARLQAQRREEEARRQEQRRQEELQRQAEARRQAEMARRQQEEERRQQEFLRQERAKKERAESLNRQAYQYWQNDPGPGLAEGVRLYREAMSITWTGEDGQSYSYIPTIPFYRACADMAEYFDARKDTAQTLVYCSYASGAAKGYSGVKREIEKSPEASGILGRIYWLQTRILLDGSSGHYHAENGYRAAELGTLCQDPRCINYLAQCFESGIGIRQDQQKAISYYERLAQYPQWKKLAEERGQALKERIFRENTAEIISTLGGQAPDAFPMVGCEALEWEAYREQILDLPALWETYCQAHSKVVTKGVLFKRKEYYYQGGLTEDMFIQSCRGIWENRRHQYSTLSPEYIPCPGEQLQADQLLQKGLERMEAQAYLDAASLLRLPALCGSSAALKALAELCTAHLQNQPLLINALSLLEKDGAPETFPLLARGYARLGCWHEAVTWAEKAGGSLLPEIRDQAVQWADRLQPAEEETVLVQALWVCQNAGNSSGCVRIAMILADRVQDPARQRQYLEQAAELGSGEACARLARLEIDAQGDPARIRSLLEQADAQGALADRELLAEQYVSGPEEDRDYVGAAKIYLELPEVRSTRLCWASCGSAFNTLNKLPEEERPLELQARLLQKMIDLGGPGQVSQIQYLLARRYYEGLGVEQDKERADALMQCSAKAGYPPAVCHVAKECIEKGEIILAACMLEPCSGDEKCAALLEEVRRLQEEEWESYLEDVRQEEEERLRREEEERLRCEEEERIRREEEERLRREDEERVRQEESSGRKDAKSVTSIRLDGEELAVKNATQAVTVTFQRLLQAHADRLEDCLREVSQLTDDETRDNSVFRKKKPIEIGGRTVWVGVSTGFQVKCVMTNRLCSVLGLPAGTVVWLGPEGTAYENE